jgi:hypothetical protein
MPRDVPVVMENPPGCVTASCICSSERITLRYEHTLIG